MNDGKWGSENLSRLLIKHQRDYMDKGLESKSSPEFDKVFYNTWIHHRMHILSLIPEECRKPKTRVVDLGGGKGRIAVLLSELGLECTIVDSLYEDNSAVNVLEQPHLPLLTSYLKGKGVCIIPQDFYQNGIPLPNEAAELVIFSEVIEHLPNSPKPVLADIWRKLVPGGWLIITTPNVASMGNRKRALFGQSCREDIDVYYKMEGYPPGSVYRGHNREFTRNEVEYMLKQEKFDIVKSMTFDYRGPDFSHGRLRRTLSGLTNSIRFAPKRISSNLSNFISILARK
jgi:2-polyprenyl-3-methyl-5-hydroxy-6-metoxy-1,4-benzoquinol methylase